MSWASGRRFLIIVGVVLVAASVLAIIAALTLNKTPSCTDGVQNQNEDGIDCGGSCAYLCSATLAEPSVAYARAVTTNGRTDVVAYVENRNPSAAAKDVKYTVELFDANRALVALQEGTVDLAPLEGVPIFIPSIHAGIVPGAQAFLSFDTTSFNWFGFSKKRVLPRAGEIRVEGTENAPRIVATMFNPSVLALRNVPLVVTVYDENGVIIAASQTILAALEGEGTATAIFTWNEAFPKVPGRITVQPILPLP